MTLDDRQAAWVFKRSLILVAALISEARDKKVVIKTSG